MKLQYYTEIRGSLNKKISSNINPETLKHLLDLFRKEKNFFDNISHPSYTERSLFSTLNGYTSAELVMNRFSHLEKKNIIILSDLITN